MNPRLRGCLILVVFLAVAAIFCGVIPFLLMPGAGVGVALPVIEVPGEVVVAEFLPGFNLTNSIIGTLVTNVIVILAIFVLWRVSKGWTKEVPGRIQGLFEAFIGAFYNFCEGIGGARLRSAPLLWPLVATIFFFLIVANYMKLLPGAETVGTMHCAYDGQSGYAMVEGWTDNSYRLWVDQPLNAGTSQNAETEELCNHYFKGDEFEEYGYQEVTIEEIETVLEGAEATTEDAVAVLVTAEEDLAALEAELGIVEPAEGEEAEEVELTEEQETALEDAEHDVEVAQEDAELAEREAERQTIRLIAASALADLEGAETFIENQLALLEGEEIQEGEAAPLEEVESQVLYDVAAEAPAITSYQDTLGDLNGNLEAAVADIQAAEDEEELETGLNDAQSAITELQNFHQTQLAYPTATLIFDESQLDGPSVPFIFHITPFVRGPATDLSFTFALAILAMIAVQIYGVLALGPAYFEKFVNLSAIGNVGKRPLGVIDFIVGLIEIISEIGKVVSLAFRLFGNLFAGGVALMAMTFLVALFVPGIIYVLELIIGAVQALVFAVLTLVFSVQAMEHHGDHEDHHDGHEAAH